MNRIVPKVYARCSTITIGACYATRRVVSRKYLNFCVHAVCAIRVRVATPLILIFVQFYILYNLQMQIFRIILIVKLKFRSIRNCES